MIRETIAVGDTVDEAIRLGSEQLGISPDDAGCEILEYPKAKTFGLFGGTPAKVRVYYEEPEEEVTYEKPVQQKHRRSEPQPKPAPEVRAEAKPEFSPEAKPEAKPEPSAAPTAQQPFARAERSESQSRSSYAPRQQGYQGRGDRPRYDKPRYDRPRTETVLPEPQDESGFAEQSRTAAAYLRQVLKGMGLNRVAVVISEDENGAMLNLVGDGLGTAIGRRGENLAALQYLVSLAANNTSEEYFRIAINIGNYREKREQTLEALAKKTAFRSLKINKNLALEPMNPYERRIVHTVVHELEGVTSWSVGEDKLRHVVIGPEGLDEGADGLPVNNGRNGFNKGPGGRGGYNRGGYNRGGSSRGGYNRGGYNREDSQRPYNRDSRGGYNRGRGGYSSRTQTPAPNTTPRKDSAGSLYGRIEVPKREEPREE